MADFLITGGDLDSDVSEDRGENLSQENREDISEENNGGPSEDHSVNDLEELDACWMLRFIESYIIDEESNVSESCSEDMEDSEDLHTTSNDNSEEHDGSRDNPDHNIDETDHGLFQTITEQRMWRTLLGFFSFSNNRDSEQEQSDSSGDEITDGCHLIECWMPRFDLDQTIKLKISHGRSISIVDLLRKREITGTVEYQDNAAERGTLLALVLQNRWSSVKLGEIFIDARKMLNRRKLLLPPHSSSDF